MKRTEGPCRDAAGAASAEAHSKISRGHVRQFGGKEASDFVWAIRLAKVSKGLLSTNWSLDPFSSRATFGAGAGDVDVCRTVAGEGLKNFGVFGDEELGEVFVVDDEGFEAEVGEAEEVEEAAMGEELVDK